MAILHPHHRLHLILALPDDQIFAEMYQCFSEVQRDADWLTVTTERRFDKTALDGEENFVLFFKTIPPWLPLRTEAVIGLVFMGYTCDSPLDNERAYRFFQEWKKNSIRADMIFVRDPEQRSQLSHYSRSTFHNAFGFYNAKVLGAVKYSNNTANDIDNPFYTPPADKVKKLMVASYGEATGRRGKIVEGLMQHMPKNSYVHLPSPSPEERRKLLLNSRIGLHIRACNEDESYDPFFVSEMLATDAMMVFENGTRWPLDDDGEQCYRVHLDDPKSAAETLIHLSSRQNDCLKTARRANAKFNGTFSALNVVDNMISHGTSVADL